jgi:hypothetical protein
MSEGPRVSPESDIYTVLVIIATILVAASTIFLCVRSEQLFGSWNPFKTV